MIPTLPTRFQLTEFAGQGRFGDVWRARDASLERDIAVKIVAMTGRSDAEIKRLVAEARISSRLRHPNILSAYDAITFKEQLILCFPYLGGGTLDEPKADLLATVRDKVVAFTKLVQANEYLHRVGWLHGDLKPQNVLLDAKGQPFLTDFGSAIPLRQTQSHTHTPDLVGTPAYLAPELVEQNAQPTVSSEIYALGAVLYHSITGQPPFEGDTQAVLHQIATESFPSPRKLLPKIDRDLEAIILTACEHRPRDRYQSTGEFVSDLERYLADEPTLAREPTLLSRIQLWAKRNRTSAKFVASVAASILIATLISVIGAVYANTLERASIRSRETLQAEGARAAAADEQLRALLASTAAEQKSAEASLASAATFRQQAESAKATALAAKQKADDLAKQAASTAEEIQKVMVERKSAEEKLAETQATIRNNEVEAAHNLYLDQLTKTRTAIAAKDWFLAKRILEKTQESFRGLEYAILDEQINNREKVLPEDRFPIVDTDDAVVFDRTGNQIAVLGASHRVALLNTQKESRSTLDPLPRKSTTADSLNAEVACFDPEGKFIAVGYQLSPTESAVAIWNLQPPPPTAIPKQKLDELLAIGQGVNHLSNPIVVTKMRSKGTIASLRFLGPDRLFGVLRDPIRGEAVLYEFFSERKLWSAIESRRSAGMNDADNQKLETYFIDLGTDPMQGICIVSSHADTVSGLCVHWIQLTPDPKIDNFNFGPSNGTEWPSRWSIEPETPIGIGKMIDHKMDRASFTPSKSLNDQIQVFHDKRDSVLLEDWMLSSERKLSESGELMFDFSRPSRLHFTSSVIRETNRMLPKHPNDSSDRESSFAVSIRLQGRLSVSVRHPWLFPEVIDTSVSPYRSHHGVSDQLRKMANAAVTDKVVWAAYEQPQSSPPVFTPIEPENSETPKGTLAKPTPPQRAVQETETLAPKRGPTLNELYPPIRRRLVKKWPNSTNEVQAGDAGTGKLSAKEWNIATVANNQLLVFNVSTEGDQIVPLIHFLPERDFNRGSPLGTNNGQQMFAGILQQWPTISGPSPSDISIGRFTRPGEANTYDVIDLVRPGGQGNTIAVFVESKSISVFLNNHHIDTLDVTLFANFQLPVVIRCQAFFQSTGESISISDCATYAVD